MTLLLLCDEFSHFVSRLVRECSGVRDMWTGRPPHFIHHAIAVCVSTSVAQQ